MNIQNSTMHWWLRPILRGGAFNADGSPEEVKESIKWIKTNNISNFHEYMELSPEIAVTTIIFFTKRSAMAYKLAWMTK